MTSMQHWTPEQWAVFSVTIAAGVIAAALLAVLRHARWTPPALLRARGPGPRPTVLRAVGRVPMPSVPSSHDCNEHEPYEHTTWRDPMRADFTDPGIGALSSIQIMTVDPTLKTSVELHAEESAWVNAYADLSGQMPETDAAAETMRVNLEPVMRKAKLWRVRGEGGPARQALNDWRMQEHTGEHRMLTTADLAPYARALLAS